jgi:hypothetical protein
LVKRSDDGVTYAVEQRLRLIDFLLHQYGHINRSAIEEFFGISGPQASNDLQLYIALEPTNMEYSLTAKRYERTQAFARRYP